MFIRSILYFSNQVTLIHVELELQKNVTVISGFD